MAVNFDPVARLYRWTEYLSFGPMLERCRETYLARLTEARRALVLGDGDGRFLARLLAVNPGLTVDVVDSSRRMLRVLESRVESRIGSRQRINLYHADALAWEPAGNYDLIVTHFFLDCFTQPELDSLCAQIVPYLQPQTLWLVSDFRIPAGALNLPARVLVRLLYLAFRVLTGLRTTALPDHTAVLTAASFTRICQNDSLAGLLTSQLWEYTPAMLPPQKPKVAPIADPVPDPEPASPSLPEPDPGVFHHEPGTHAPEKRHPTNR